MASDSEKREEKQWSEFPEELLVLIFKKLRLISDCIRFGGVCKSWRSASQPTAATSSLHPQLPLLLLPYLCFTDSRSFFSLSTNSIHTLSLPNTCCKEILASSHGWLLLADFKTKAISLLNPITEAQIQLPPLPEYHPEIDGTNLTTVVPHKGVISSSPSSAEHDCVVITITCQPWKSHRRHVNFCRPGRDEVWTKLKTSPILDSVVYSKGRFYMLDLAGVVTVYDAVDPSVKILSLPKPAFALQYFLVKASETELLFCAYSRELSGGMDLRHFKMDLSGQMLEWSEIDGIGDKALFLTREKCSCSMVCARDFPGCKEGCVYYETPFFDDDLVDAFLPQNHNIKVINIKDGSYEFIRCAALGTSAKHLMAPVWFTPSLY
ncbi:F-box protein At2g26160-like [Elaeis guineensis]|uniref:F-box protein At5g55150 n=1 Tax=Elaeis guineensis var. tenera TaxID=51953 RepID=A0A8N4EZK1_ELAGV|nr:putative F-box protein At5g55150 [Elaeis guineensis]